MAKKTFNPISDNDTYELRKTLELPVTKPLRYMHHNNDLSYTACAVTDYVISEEYPTWYLLKVTLEDGTEVNVHSAFFAQMQKPSFVEDMAKAVEETD